MVGVQCVVLVPGLTVSIEQRSVFELQLSTGAVAAESTVAPVTCPIQLCLTLP